MMGWILATGITLVALLIICFLFWRLWFLRLPFRHTPSRGIVSPANGRLVKIIPFSDKGVQGIPKGMLGMVKTLTSDVAKSGYVLVITLTVFEVHYQRYPISGVIEKVVYSRGKFRNAVKGAADFRAFENEKNEVLIKGNGLRVKVVQVAGLLARRISCYAEEGQDVQRGEVLGLINMGSQVLVVMPKKKLRVAVGQMMIDGETVIA